jgi:fused signal recognition particle receptor
MAEFHPLPMPDTLPGPAPVRLELRDEDGPPSHFTLPYDSILIGCVPGCDVRLPGGELPPLLCVLTPEPGGLRLRKLASQPAIEVNGQKTIHALLTGNDVLSLGRFKLGVQFQPPATEKAVAPGVRDMLQAQQLMLEEGIRRLADAQKQLADDRRDWEQDAEKQAEELAAKMRHVLERSEVLAQERAQLAAERAELDARAAPLHAPLPHAPQGPGARNSSLDPLRAQLEAYRDQLHKRFKQRRDHLLALQESVSHAARKVQEQKRVTDAESARVRAESEQLAARATELVAEADQVAREKTEVAEQHRLIEEWQREIEKEHQARVAEVQAEEKRQARERQHLDALQAELLGEKGRLERLQDGLVEREAQCDTRAKLVEEQTLRLKELAGSLQEQARAVQDGSAQNAAAAKVLARQQAELEQRVRDFDERAAAVGSEQAALLALRTRTERLQAELMERERELTEHRLQQEREAVRLREFAQRLQGQEAQLVRQREHWLAEKREVESRSAALDAQGQEIAQREKALLPKEAELQGRVVASEQAQKDLAQRGDELAALSSQLHTERQELDAAKQQLVQERQAAEAMQEQLRRRSKSVSERERHVAEQSQKNDETAKQLQEREAELDGHRAALRGRDEALAGRESALMRQLEQLRGDWAALEQERQALQRERQEADTRHREATAACERLASERRTLEQRLPELMQRVHAALERLAQAREQLRDHLREVHEYSQQCQTEFQAAQRDLLIQAERLHAQQHALHRAQDEHRHAVGSFRQYISEWQGQIAEVQRSIAHGESSLERRQVQLADQARQVDETSSRLVEKEEQLEGRERDVLHVRQQLDRHLADMQQWYRHKLRELAERKLLLDVPQVDALTTGFDPCVSASPHLPVDVTPEDRRLVDLLMGLALIEEETLRALLQEARQRGCSLKDALLDGDYLTPFQLELIEAGHLEALVLGPLRIVDRLRLTPLETVYRVFDPRRGEEALLRRLSGAVTDERRDEFQAKFAKAATLRHPHLAATLEVLDMEDSPAVLQEWVVGVPSGEWRELAGVPVVWLRLLEQAAAGLAAAHEAGLVHGHLHAGRVLLTETGQLKICGLGEPEWLFLDGETVKAKIPEPASDLAALGRIAKAWFVAGTGQRPQRRDSEPMQAILDRLLSNDPTQRYASLPAFLEHIERAQAALDDHPGAWERLVRFVRERLLPSEPAGERRSA